MQIIRSQTLRLGVSPEGHMVKQETLAKELKQMITFWQQIIH